MKNIFFFGASFYQEAAIKILENDSDFRLFIFSGMKNDPLIKSAKNPVIVDILSPDAVLQKVNDLGITPNACITTCTDWPLSSIGRLNDVFNLPGITEEVANFCFDKIQMKKRFKQHKVPSANFNLLESYEDFMSKKDDIIYPSFFKAPKGSGSRGILKVDSSNEVDKVKEVFSCSKNQAILVEEPLVGHEFGAQVIVQHGRVTNCFLHRDTVTSPPIQVPIGHSVPYLDPNGEIYKKTKMALSLAVEALNIQNSVCNCDLILDSRDGQVKVIEISPRVGATGLAEIIKLSYGVDLYSVAINLALGLEVSIPEVIEPICSSAILTIRSDSNGVLKGFDGLQNGIDFLFKTKPGGKVKKFTNGPDILGMMLTSSKDGGVLDLEEELLVAHQKMNIIFES